MTLHIASPKPRLALQSDIKRPSREKSEDRDKKLLWLDKNENMDPIYMDFIQALVTKLPVEAYFGYPDCHALYKKLANHLNVAINQLIFSAGSDGIIRAVHDAFISPGDTIIYTEPTFAMYTLYAQMYGAASVKLHYEPSNDGPILHAETVMKAIHDKKPKLVCLPNPNSPSGTVFTQAALRKIIEAAHQVGAVILIDEAYYPFYPETCMTWINDFPNLIIAQTFSKAWGLAGIRIGFGIANASLISELHKIRPMYEAGALSVILAQRILDYPAEMQKSVERLNAGKKYFLDEMQSLGFRSYPSHGNFLHVAFGASAAKIHEALADKVLYRKDFDHPSLKGFSRFSATIQSQFEPLVAIIKDVVRGQ